MTRTRSILLLALAVLATIPALARADEGPLVIANQEKHPYLTLDPIHGALAATGYYQKDSTKNNDQSRSTAADTLFSQDLTLSTGGAIISRNLANWTAVGTLSLQEEWTTGSQQTDAASTNASSTGIFTTYDLEFNGLNTTAYPFNLFATRSENLVNRSFAAMLRDINTTYGGSFHYNAGPLPSSLTLSHTTTTQQGLDGSDQFTIDQNDLEFSTSYQPNEHHNLSLSYHYASVDQNNPGTLSSSSELQGLSLAHNWAIDNKGQYTLTQNFDYSTQTGTYPFTQYRLGEQLRMHYSDTLESILNYTMEQHDYATTSTTRNALDASITHRLFDSLVTSARAGGSISQNSFNTDGQNDTSTTKDYHTDITFDYQKKLWLGRLGANFNVGYVQTDNGSVGVSQQVLGELQTFSDPQPIILTRPGLNPSTLAVFNAAGTRQFILGTDYTVRTVGQTQQINRIVGGNIANDDSVRLNYQVDPLPGYTSSSMLVGMGVNYLFEEGPLTGLNVYGRYSQVNQSISPATSNIIPDDTTDSVAGAEYRFWKMTLRAEDEHRTSTLAPMDAQRFSARYDERLGDRTTLTLGATQYYIQYPLLNSNTVLTTLDGRLQYQISRGLTSTLTTMWRNQDDSGIGVTTGFETQLELRWKIRQTDIFGMVRHTDLDTPDSSGQTFFFQFGVSRSF